MTRVKWFFHPIIILILSILAMGLSLFLYIRWYVEASAGLQSVIDRANLDRDQVLAPQTWVVILVLSILVGIILLGLLSIFVYNQKTRQLYRLQRNFIGNFTHELRTPVASMKLYLETLRKYDLPREEQLKYLDYMITDADRLSHNISRILNLARIESKTWGGQFEIVDLVEEAESFRERNDHLFEGCTSRVHNPSGETFTCRLNRDLFGILLMNLFTNAVTYNRSQKPALDLIFEPARKGVTVRFEDNGIGIGTSERKKVFRKFYQSGSAEDRSARGTGLGLYLVELIARMHKGTIKAAPRKEGGSTFTLFLPTAAAERRGAR